MSQGVPIVAANTEGVPDSVTDGVNGFLVQSGDSVKMAEAIDRLIKSPSLRNQFIVNGINKVREKFTSELIIDKIELYLRNCLSNGGI
jgi:glycosyltransferase involved in cell wall biosynthesis